MRSGGRNSGTLTLPQVNLLNNSQSGFDTPKMTVTGANAVLKENSTAIHPCYTLLNRSRISTRFFLVLAEWWDWNADGARCFLYHVAHKFILIAVYIMLLIQSRLTHSNNLFRGCTCTKLNRIIRRHALKHLTRIRYSTAMLLFF